MENDRPDERERAAELRAGTTFDLAECVAEPIHRLGGVQSYGALLALDAAGRVEVASANCAAVLGVATDDLIGRAAADLLGPEAWDAVTATLAAPTGDRGMVDLAPTEIGAGATFDVTVYRADGRVVLEFEPPAEARPFRFAQFYPSVRTALTRLQLGRGVVDVCAAAVAEIRALTGYDRVVAYRFEGPEGPGEVIAESVADELDPWLGLWFPAADIPPQARRLYERNLIRVIDDVDDAVVPLVPPVLPDTDAPLDLSDSALRSVSGFHLEYLRNIGVVSSMSVSVLRGGRLWGLIACHGLRPRRLSAELRAACEFFGVALSLQLAVLEEAERGTAREVARAALARLVGDLDGDVATYLAESSAPLAELVPADAVVLRSGEVTTVVAGTRPPDERALDALWAHAPTPPTGQVWSSAELTATAPALAAHAEAMSGVLMLGIGGDDVVVWTRRERTAARTWATDPDTPVRVGARGERLTPRGSSAVYREVVRGRCLPWTTADEAAAEEFGLAVTRHLARTATHAATVNAELRRANRDLDTFTHVAAHEMKEPLRGIATTAAFIAEDDTGLDPVTRHRLDTIQSLAQRMDELINSLLHFAQLGQADLRPVTVDLGAAVDRALEIAGPRLAEHQVGVTMPPAGTTVTADQDRLQEILINLLVNAAKYARADLPRTVAIGTATTDNGPAVYVRDNGIGISPAHQQEVFRLFRRLHPPDTHGGGHGAGLAIVDRIVERHGGVLWLESTEETGTTVWFTFSRP